MDIKAARTEGFYGQTCAYWLAGRCNRKHCRFSHKLPSVPPTKNPKYNAKDLSVKKNGGDETSSSKAGQRSSQSVCKYWISGNCIHGDQCWNLHSLFQGDGFSMLTKLHEHKKIVTGIALPVGSDKLFSGSTDGTVQLWDCHTGQCFNVINLGGEVRSLISEGPRVFAGVPNAVKAWNTQTAAEFTLDGPKGQVFSLVVGNDTLFAGAKDGVIYAWRGSSETNSPFAPVASLSGHTGAIVCLTVGRKKLYSGSMDHTIKGVVALGGMTDPEGKHIMFCSCNDHSVRLYELPSFSLRGQLFSKQEI